jgi:hypothetical protein
VNCECVRAVKLRVFLGFVIIIIDKVKDEHHINPHIIYSFSIKSSNYYFINFIPLLPTSPFIKILKTMQCYFFVFYIILILTSYQYKNTQFCISSSIICKNNYNDISKQYFSSNCAQDK